MTPNAAVAPQVPPVDKVICTFEGGTGSGAGLAIKGSALLSMQEYLNWESYDPGAAHWHDKGRHSFVSFPRVWRHDRREPLEPLAPFTTRRVSSSKA